MTHAGDYQTERRMGLKRKAIPLPNLKDKRVLDVGCDHGYWSHLAAMQGAAHVLGVDRGRYVRGAGHVDLVERNNAQGWERCEFVYADLGKQWPRFGKFDVVFCFSLYHHWYGQCGKHERIWKWLARHVAVGGVLLWEGPVDTRDSTAKQVTEGVGNYTRASILGAAKIPFNVQIVGDALHRAYREVWCCTLKGDVDARARAQEFVDASKTKQPPLPSKPIPTKPTPAKPVVVVPLSAEEQRARVRAERRARAAAKPKPRKRLPRPKPTAQQEAEPALPKEAEPTVDPATAATHSKLQDLLCAVTPPNRTQHLAGAQAHREGLAHPEWAIVLGGGEGVWDDVLAWEELYGRQWDGLVIAANDVGCHWPRHLDHWCTLHPTKMPDWKVHRGAQGFPADYITWGRRRYDLDGQLRPWAGGASGMYAIQLARWFGCERAVLCGVPMTASPHFVESTLHAQGREWPEVESHWRAWQRHVGKMRGWVRSMSGRTAETLGVPTLEWLRGEE